jgi:hypothetical protein
MNGKIDRSLAGWMMDAIEHVTNLRHELDDMRWVMRSNVRPLGYTHSARKECRALLSALGMIDFCLRGDNVDDENVVSIEKEKGR